MRTPRLLDDLFSRIAEVGHSLVASKPEESLGELCEALLSGRGEATGLALAGEIFERYAALDDAAKQKFFAEAVHRFGVDEKTLTDALSAWHDANRDDGNKNTRDDNVAKKNKNRADRRAIHYASEPRSQELIRRLNRVPGGTRALVAMRTDLLAAAKNNPALKPLDNDFRHLLASWFNRGFLELRRIDWSSSAEILEKIIAYEAVHAIAGWDDLRLRVAAPDRRLYAFFHPALADEPLIFVEVALTDKIPGAITPILAHDSAMSDANAAGVAVFYSISNCQAGLRGVSFGSFLIKQVVEELQGEFKSLKTFATLSPLPGLRSWALAECARGDAGVLTESQRAAIQKINSATDIDNNANEKNSTADTLRQITARYLIEAKSPRGGPHDPVARFHLGNGARLEWINPNADPSRRGIENSWGVMVNYLYDLSAIERNHEAFANDGKIICASAVKKLLKK